MSSASPAATPSKAIEAAPAAEPEDEELAATAAPAGISAVGAPATYRQRIGRAPVTARVGPAASPRASRALVTDYSYIVSELKRIGLTFGGLIVLLVIISRFLH
jgi:hypothetical protein